MASLKSTGAFCVAKYEMKAEDSAGALYNGGVGEFAYIADPKPASRADGKPWVNINREQAQAECASLGAGFSLPLNAQWQALARNLEGVVDNWVGGVAGTGIALKGHSDGFPPSALAAATDDALSFFETGNSATQEIGADQSRVFTTSRGDKIWDFAGNVREWVLDDLELLGANPPLSPSAVELETLSDINRLLFGPSTKDSRASASLGRVLASEKGAILRGGGMRSRDDAGIFSTYAVTSPAFAFSDFGFRCVYVPSSK
jgi:formylglycine-generating enzyme required for sulfatase activity